MPTYVGFSTINADKARTTNNVNPPVNQAGQGIIRSGGIKYGKKFRLVDEQLVIQDFINALNIRRGEKVGNPAYGTILWDFVFEPNTIDVVQQLQNEVRRVAALDPRLYVNTVRAYPRDNGILVEMQLSINPFNNAGDLALFFDQQTNSAVLL